MPSPTPTPAPLALALLFLLCIVQAQARTRWHQLEGGEYGFAQYLSEFGKAYKPDEHKMRETIFNANLERIVRHNREARHSFKMGVNHMTDWTHEEFMSMNGFKHNVNPPEVTKSALRFRDLYPTPSKLEDLPTSVDWREKGAVTPVKNQGRCGSCWTFGSATTVESHLFIKTGELYELSEQQIASCTPNPQHCGGTGGCEGGTGDIAFAAIKEAGGLASEWTYPYRSYYGEDFSCNKTMEKPARALVTDYVKIDDNDYQQLMEAVATVGPVVINADASEWRHYESGVFDGCSKSNITIDHTIQLVGYGVDEVHGNYWLVRNSWSPTFGESGYIRLMRSDGTPSCGMDYSPGQGTGCSGGPSPVKVCGECGMLYQNVYPIVAAPSVQ